MKHGIIAFFLDILDLLEKSLSISSFFLFFFFSNIICGLENGACFFGMGNGSFSGEDDDSLYHMVNWEGNPMKAFIISTIVVSVISALLCIFVWML